MKLKKKLFFCSFLFLFCFSLTAQEEESSVFDNLLELDEVYEEEAISCSELPGAFEKYKNNIRQSHNLSPVLTDLRDFLKTVQSTKKLLLEELDNKINTLNTTWTAAIAIKNQLVIDQEPINYALDQCLSSSSNNTNINCESLPQSFKEYNSHVSLSHQSLNVLLRSLIRFLENIKESKKPSLEEIEKTINNLEEAGTIISENKHLFTTKADQLSSHLNECLIN